MFSPRLKFLQFLAIMVFAATLLFELLPPVTWAGGVGIKPVPLSELVSASVEGASPQTTPLARRLALVRHNTTVLGIGDQVEGRMIILLITAVMAAYFALPTRMRFLRPLADEADEAARRYALYRSFTALIEKPFFAGATLLLVIGLMIQQEMSEVPGSLVTMVQTLCTSDQPCRPFPKPVFVAPF